MDTILHSPVERIYLRILFDLIELNGFNGAQRYVSLLSIGNYDRITLQ